MANTAIQLKKSGQTGNTPVDLQHGEVAINYADGKLYYKDDVDSIQFIQNQDTFGTINVDGSLIIATSPTDVLELQAFNGISITPDSVNKKLTFEIDTSGITAFVKKSGDLMLGDLNVSANIHGNYIIADRILYAGRSTQDATDLPNVISQFTSNSETYIQVNAQNVNGNGSADFVITADVGTDTDYYTDIGMGGNTYNYYNGYDTPFEPLTGYFLVQGSTTGQPGGNMVIGTTSPSTNVRFLSGGFETPNVTMSLEPDSVSIKKDLSVDGSITGPTITTMQNYTQSAFDKANTANITYTSSNTAPSTPKLGDEWYKINEDILYVYSTDGSSDFWLDITSASLKTSDGEFLDSVARTTANAAFNKANTFVLYNDTNVATYLTNSIETGNQTVTGNVIPSSNNTYSLGDANHQWKDLWVSNNTIYIDKQPLSISEGKLKLNGSAIGGTDQTARDVANSASILSQAAYDYANTIVSDTQVDPYARLKSNNAYDAANSSSSLAQNAYNQANTGVTLAQAAYDYANTIVSDTQIDPYAREKANGAFDKANSANTLAQNAYNKANNNSTLTQIVFDSSNTKYSKTGGEITGDVTITGNLQVDGVITGTVAGGAGGGSQYFSANTDGSIWIGYPGYRSNQSSNAVSVGAYSGLNTQGNDAIAIGNHSGYREQGNNSIAIGAYSGYDYQSPHSVVINATGNVLNASNTGLYVAPIREDVIKSSANTETKILFYDSVTKEITYGDYSYAEAPSGGGGGTAVWRFQSSGSGTVQTPHQVMSNIGSSDFTVECWARFSSFPIYSRLLSLGGYGASGNFEIEVDPSNILIHINGSFQQYYLSSTLSPDTWYHIAVVRQSGLVTLYIDGTANYSNSQDGDINNTSTTFRVGGDPLGDTIDGYMTNLRIVQGTALYTSNFTPPTTALTAISGTRLLTLQDSTLIDNGPYAYTVTIAGSPEPFSGTTPTPPVSSAPTSGGLTGNSSTAFCVSLSQSISGTSGTFTPPSYTANGFIMNITADGGGSANVSSTSPSFPELPVTGNLFAPWSKTIYSTTSYTNSINVYFDNYASTASSLGWKVNSTSFNNSFWQIGTFTNVGASGTVNITLTNYPLGQYGGPNSVDYFYGYIIPSNAAGKTALRSFSPAGADICYCYYEGANESTSRLMLRVPGSYSGSTIGTITAGSSLGSGLYFAGIWAGS